MLMGTKLREYLISEWPPSTWHRRPHRGAIKTEGPHWHDPGGEARLQDVVDRGSGSVILVVSDASGQEWANTIELADERATADVAHSLTGALGRRLADVADIRVTRARTSEARRGT